MDRRLAGLAIALAGACSAPKDAPKPLPPAAAAAWTDPAPHRDGFVSTGTARLHYLDWGGTGPYLILLHGLGANPHIYDDLVPALGGKFHVVAYARRGHELSSKAGPFDTATLVGDLFALMDSLRIPKASLAGWSMGGNEITRAAGLLPDRIERIVYLDAGYDWADPAFAKATADQPFDQTPPATAFASLDGYRAWQRELWFGDVSDGSRIEAYIRGLVAVSPTGAVTPLATDSVLAGLAQGLRANQRDYSKVRPPALAIYAATFFDAAHGDSAHRAQAAAWETKYLNAFRTASIARLEREIKGSKTMVVPGNHVTFFFVSRDAIAQAMTEFLAGPGAK